MNAPAPIGPAASARMAHDALIESLQRSMAAKDGMLAVITPVFPCIEDQKTLDALRTLGCDSGQGYFIARPMPQEQLEPWLDARRYQD